MITNKQLIWLLADWDTIATNFDITTISIKRDLLTPVSFDFFLSALTSIVKEIKAESNIRYDLLFLGDHNYPNEYDGSVYCRFYIYSFTDADVKKMHNLCNDAWH